MKQCFRILAITLAVLLFTNVYAFAVPKKTVKIVYVEWPCAVVSSTIAKVAIEDRLGYEVELISVSAPIMFQALATGEADATLTAWLPHTHASYMEKLKGKIVDLGPIVNGAKLGWVVPDYVPMDNMEELAGNADKFDGKVYGIDAGASYMSMSETAITAYNLSDFNLMEGSDAVMISMLSDAIKRKEWIVVTGWTPHWKFARWPLHFLKDPKGIFGGEESIHSVARNGLDKDMPEVYAFLNNFYYKDTMQLQQQMAENAKKGANPEKNARAFITANKEQVDSWFIERH